MREKSEMTLREAAQQALEALENHAMQYPHMQKGYTVDAITDLRAALAEPTSQQPKQVEPAKWISIEENLPKKDQLVLGLYYKSNIRIVYRREREDIDAEWADSGSGHSLIPPTHWMPLPEYEHVHKMESKPTINESETGEPVAWQWLDTAHFRKNIHADATPSEWRPLYTAPPKLKPMTDEEIDHLAQQDGVTAHKAPDWFAELARAIERAHGIGGEE